MGMESSGLSHAVVTPVRNEADNLRRLAGCLVTQSVKPVKWVIVDNGSTDETPALAGELAHAHDWIELRSVPGAQAVTRGGPVVRAFHAGIAALERHVDVVTKLDADTSFEPDYFERLLAHFAEDADLGIAGGNCYELEGGTWRAKHVTSIHVRGAARSYRWACLQDVLPLEERMGWDGVDELKASVRGWTTRLILDLPFRHHRRVGIRDGARRRAAIAQGDAAYFMGYRFWYLVARALHNARSEPASLAMIWGYVAAAARRKDRCADALVRDFLRSEQSLRKLPLRMREALGRRPL